MSKLLLDFGQVMMKCQKSQKNAWISIIFHHIEEVLSITENQIHNTDGESKLQDSPSPPPKMGGSVQEVEVSEDVTRKKQ